MSLIDWNSIVINLLSKQVFLSRDGKCVCIFLLNLCSVLKSYGSLLFGVEFLALVNEKNKLMCNISTNV